MLEIKRHEKKKAAGRQSGSCEGGKKKRKEKRRHSDHRRLRAPNRTTFAIRVQHLPPGPLTTGATAHFLFGGLRSRADGVDELEVRHQEGSRLRLQQMYSLWNNHLEKQNKNKTKLLKSNSPRLRVLLVHALLALLEQADGLLGLLGQVLHEDPEVLVVSQGFHLALVARQDGAQVLVGVGQQVQDVGGAVLQSQFGVLAEAHHLRAEGGWEVRDQTPSGAGTWVQRRELAGGWGG